MKDSNKLVSIISINYNGWKDTCELIRSFKELETFPFEFIVVDNASKGNDVQQIKKMFPDITLIASPVNLGFAGGNNLGLKYAQGDYIFFLNNDIVIKEAVLLPLVKRLESSSRIGALSPIIYSYYKPDEIQYFGYKDMTPITLRHTTLPFNPVHKDRYLQPSDTDILHGAAMLVKREIIEKVGTMSEAYFLFYEEFDWSLRIRAAGYTLFYEPSAAVYHKESVSIPRATPLREFYLTRSRVIYARRNCKGWKKWVACGYQIFIAVPHKLLHYLLVKRYDLFSSILKGLYQGLFVSLSTKLD